MMSCIKTGAYIHFPDYSLYAPADLYQVGNSIVCRFNGDPRAFGGGYNCQRNVTHTIAANFVGDNFIRFDLGIVVVEARAVTIHKEPNT